MAPKRTPSKTPGRAAAPKARAIAADNPNSVPVMVRMGGELLTELDAWVERLNAGATGPRWTRSDVMRATLQRAVRERGAKGESP